jgi:hypothetical protein
MRQILALLALLLSVVGASAQIQPAPGTSFPPLVVASTGLTNQTANVNQPTAYSVPRSGMYRVSCYIVLTTAATTSSTLPGCTVTYTEATTGQAVSDAISTCSGCTTNAVGLHIGGSAVIQAQLSSNIGYSTSGYVSSGATPMAYRVDFKVEALQ